jgi:hypothetical protein
MLMDNGKGTITAELLVAIVALAVAVLGLVPKWVPFLEERPHLTGRIQGPVRGLRRWWQLLGAITLVLAAGCAALQWPEWRGMAGLACLMMLLWWFRQWIQLTLGGWAAGLLLGRELLEKIQSLGDTGLEALAVMVAVAEPWQGNRMIVRLERTGVMYRRRKSREAGWSEGPYDWLLEGCVDLHRAGLVSSSCADWRGLDSIAVWPTGGWQRAPTRQRVQMFAEGKLASRGVWGWD